MTKKALFLFLSAAVTLSVACGDDTDPSKNNAPNATANNVTTPENNNNSTPNNSTTTTPDNQSTNNQSTPNNMSTPCEAPDPSFFGQIGADATSVKGAGGAPDVGGTYAAGSGLQAVLAAMPTEEEEVVLDTPLAVSEALVISTGFIPNTATSPARYYIQTGDGAVEVFLPFDYESPVDIRVGMVISFDVVSVENFGNSPQIASIDNLAMNNEGVAVPIVDGSARALTPDDLGKIVKVGGVLDAASERACGGDSFCWDLPYGNGTVTFRTDSEFIEAGSCVTFVGPLRSFPGPIGNSLTAGDLQIDQINYSWARTPFVE